MSLINNGEIIGNPNKNLVLETAGHVYIKVSDRYYEVDFKNLNNIDHLIGNLTYNTSEIQTVDQPKQETISEEVDLDNYITSDELKSILKGYVTNRSWKDVQDTQKALEKSMIDGFSESITPITVQTMQLTVGAEQLQYDIIEDIDNNTLGEQALVVDSETKGLIFTPCCIKHYTLGGPDKAQDYESKITDDSQEINLNKQKNLAQYWRWFIKNSNNKPQKELILLDDGTYYFYFTVPYLKDLTTDAPKSYVFDEQGQYIAGNEEVDILPNEDIKYYERVNKGTGANTNNNDWLKYNNPSKIELEYSKDPEDKTKILYGPGLYHKTDVGYMRYSAEALPYEDTVDGEPVYNLLYAIVTNNDGTPSISTMNGFTEITPGQVRAYIFASPDGNSFIDFKRNRFKFGEKLLYSDGQIYINGAIVQRGTKIVESGNPMIIYQGSWKLNNNYYINDIVTYSNKDENIPTSTYICILDIENSTLPPNEDTAHWSPFAEGVNGRDGASVEIKGSVNSISELCNISDLTIGSAFLWGQYMFLYAGQGNGNIDTWNSILPANWKNDGYPCEEANAWYCSGKFQGDPGKDGVVCNVVLSNQLCDIIVGSEFDYSNSTTKYTVYYGATDVTNESVISVVDNEYVECEVDSENHTIKIISVTKQWSGTLNVIIKCVYNNIETSTIWLIDYDDDGNNIELEPSGTVFIYDPNNNIYIPNSITIKSNITGGFSDINWEYSIGSEYNIIENVNGITISDNVVTVTPEVFNSNNQVSIKCIGTLANGNTDYDLITLYKAKDGEGWLLHTKWANLSSSTSESNKAEVTMSDGTTKELYIEFTESSGETPGQFIGQYINSDISDTSNIADYVWRQWNGQDGQDGFGTEQIFKLSSSLPKTPIFSDEDSGITEDQFNTFDYVPKDWSDSPLSPTETESCYVSTRRLNKSVNWTSPVIYSSYTKAIYHVESDNESDIINTNDVTGKLVSDFKSDITLFGSYGEKKCLVQVSTSNVTYNGIIFKYDPTLTGNSFYIENNWNGDKNVSEEYNNPIIHINFAKDLDVNSPIVLQFQVSIFCKGLNIDSRFIKYTLTGLKNGEDGVCYRLTLNPNLIKWLGDNTYDIDSILASVTKYKGEEVSKVDLAENTVSILYKLFYYDNNTVETGKYTDIISIANKERIDRIEFYLYNDDYDPDVTDDWSNYTLLDSETLTVVNGVASKGDPGLQGPITRFTKWVSNRYYYNGTTKSYRKELDPNGNGVNYFIDYVYYNDNYYQCITTHLSTGSAPNLSYWTKISSFEILATGTLLVGKENGWVIDQGVIKHNSGKVSLNSDGSISASNGKFIVDNEGNLSATNANIGGIVAADKFLTPFIDIKSLTNSTDNTYRLDSNGGSSNIIVNLNDFYPNVSLYLEQLGLNGLICNILVLPNLSKNSSYLQIQFSDNNNKSTFFKSMIPGMGYDSDKKVFEEYFILQTSKQIPYYITFCNINSLWYLINIHNSTIDDFYLTK